MIFGRGEIGFGLLPVVFVVGFLENLGQNDAALALGARRNVIAGNDPSENVRGLVILAGNKIAESEIKPYQYVVAVQ